MIIQSQPLFHKAMEHGQLHVNMSGHVVTDKSWHQRPLYSLDSRLYFVTDGAGMICSDSEEMPLEPGYVYLMPCGSKCGFYGSPSVTKLFFHVGVKMTPDGDDVFSKLTRFVKLPYSIEKTNELKKLYFSTDPLDHLLLKGALWETLVTFIQSEKGNFSNARQYSAPVCDAIRFICTNLNARLTVKEIAAAAYCSQSKLSAKFQAELGQTVAAYVDELLMSEAKNCLSYTDKSIGKISESLGFCDQFYFSRIFRKRFGISPSEYRKMGRS